MLCLTPVTMELDLVIIQETEIMSTPLQTQLELIKDTSTYKLLKMKEGYDIDKANGIEFRAHAQAIYEAIVEQLKERGYDSN